MKGYAKYVEVESRWAKYIPESWTFSNIAEVFIERKENNNPIKTMDILSLTNTRGVIPYKEKGNIGNKAKEDLTGYRLAYPGDIVFNSMNAVIGSVGLSKYFGAVSPVYYMLYLRDTAKNNIRFFDYVFHDRVFQSGLNGLGNGILEIRMRIPMSKLKYVGVPVPPRTEQDQIVRYLDWQVSKINRLIAAKRKQIALLHEQRKRRISEAVLHGNDDGCCQKDSGVEWIGMIPEHWSVIRCKYVFTERDERSIAGEEEHLSMSQKYGLVPDSKLDERRMLSESYVGGKVCYKNDLVLNRLKAHLGVFALSPQKGVISPDYTVLIPNAERILPTYGEAVLKNDLCRRELRIRVRGIIEGFWRLYTDDFNTIVIPLPPLKEQEQIMKHLSALNNKFTALKQRLEQEINILHELRTRLISDVVTGQIDVRGIKVPDVEYTYTETREEELEETEEN